MLHIAEQLAVLLFAEHVAPGVHALLVQQVLIEQMVAHLVGGIAHQDVGLLEGAGDALEADGDAVAAEDGEGQADGVGAELGGTVGGDGVHAGVVALAAGYHGLGHGHDVLVLKFDVLLLAAGEDGVGDDLDQVVAIPDDRAAHAAGCSADSSHNSVLLYPFDLRPVLWPAGLPGKKSVPII